MRVALLAGGTGAARLARGLAHVLSPGDLSVITNTGDDDELWGLLVCPDTDSVLYRLAGLFDEEKGFGAADESFHALEMLARLGEPTWFGLGDRDIGVHLLRAELRRRGASLSEAVTEIARRLGVRSAVVPMSDDPVRTRIRTGGGELTLQEWFVRDRCAPRVLGIRFAGIETARPSAAAVAAVTEAELVIIGPSNPLLSVDPILGLLSGHLARERTTAVSPVVGGRSLKGPTVAMLEQLGEEATALGVARRYAGIASCYVLDREDARFVEGVAALGMRPLILDTVMAGEEGERRLAEELLRLAGSLTGEARPR